MIAKVVKSSLRGTTLKLFLKYCKENEISESEVIRDLVRDFVKRRYQLGDSVNRTNA